MDERLHAAVERIHAERDRDRMEPTIAAFEALSAAHPEEAELVYEVAGAHDTAGEEARARVLYERALGMGLSGDARRRCFVQYGSTLRNLGEIEQSLEVLDRGAREFPDSDAIRVFRALTLVDAGRGEEAAAALLAVIAGAPPPDAERYRVAIAGYAEELLERVSRPG